MPLWAVIIIAGISGCGWLFLKARQNDIAATYRKIGGGGTKSVKKAAKQAAAKPSGIEPYQVPTSEEEVNFSADMASNIAKDLAELH